MRINSAFLCRPSEPPPPMRHDEVDRYLQELGDRRYAAKTVRNYRLDLTLAVRHIGKPLMAATAADMAAYLSHLSRQGLKATTIERKLIALKGFYKWALDQEPPLLEADPTKKLRPPRKEIRHPVHLEPDEIARVMAVLDAQDTPIHRREAAMVKCLYYAGMRASEVVGLNVDDVRAEYIRVIGKGNKERRVPLSPELRRAFDLWLEVRPETSGHPGPLFTSLGANPGRLSYDRLRGIVNRTIARAGLSRKYTAHKLRHSAATHLWRRRVPLEQIQRFLGHSNIQTTLIYSHVELDQEFTEALADTL